MFAITVRNTVHVLAAACGALALASLGTANDGQPGPLGRRPLTFVENRGQWDTPARFVARQGPMVARVEEAALVLELHRPGGEGPGGLVARLAFEGAREEVEVVGRAPLPGERNYLVGADPERWRTGVPGYAQVLYRGLHEGIDLCLRERDGRLEYDLLLAPDADLKGFSVACEGVLGLELEADGWLCMRTELGPIRQSPPEAWCELPSGERRPVDCRFVLLDERRYGFALGEPDPGLPVVIDPGLEWATFLGGGMNDAAWYWSCVAVAADGDVVVAGKTWSANFPTTPGVFDESHDGVADVFVSRLSADGSTLQWSTFLGGSNEDEPQAVALDPTGVVTVAGWTFSSDFPVTGGAVHMGQNDGFVSRLSADGSALLWSTLLGGASYDGVLALHSDGAGALTVGCYTFSTTLPTPTGGYDPTHNGGSDFYLARLDTSLPPSQAIVWGTYLGGTGNEFPKHVDLDATGAVAVSGDTTSADYPTTPGAFQTSYGGGARDACASRLNADGSTLLWSTFLGGSDDEAGNAMAAEGATGLVMLGGWTLSTDFPVTPGAYDTSPSGGNDAFVACLDPGQSGSQQLAWCTLLGGSLEDGANALALDGAGGIVLTGATESADFPTTSGATDTTLDGDWDAFVARFDRSLSGPDQLTYSTFVGGAGADYGYSVAAHEPFVATVAGPTWSADFPTTPGALDETYNGNGDAFVARLELLPAVVAYCFGDGSGSMCPCGNTGGPGAGCANSTGSGGVVAATGSTSVALDQLAFHATHLLHGQPGLLFQGESALNGGDGLLFGDGLRCAGTNVIRMGVQTPDASGAASWGPGLAGLGGWVAGGTRYLQVWYRDPSGSPCGAGFNLTNGLEVVFAP